MDDLIKTLDVVALVEDIPDHGLLKGQVGTVVEVLAPDVFEVEFIDDKGDTYALVPLPIQKLIRLRYRPEKTSDMSIRT